MGSFESDPNQPLLRDHEETKDQLSTRVWIESKKLWSIVGPAIFSRISSYTMNIITQAFAGHLGDVELAAITIANTVIVGFNFGLLLGMASALETLCGQAFGAKRYHMLGIYMQRSWLVLIMFCFLLLPFYVFASPILKWLGQTDDVAEMSGVIAVWMIPLHFSFAFIFPVQRFLQCQLKNQVIAWVALVGLLINVLTSWLFVYVLDWGVIGAAVALDISWWVLFIGLFGYTALGGCPLTWSGFSMEAFSGLWEYIKLSVASGVMLCLENWYYRILILMTGHLKNATLAVDALSVCMNINGWQLMIPLAFFAATGVRVANELGAGNGKAARFATIVSVVQSTVVGLIFCILIMILKEKVALIFTSSEDVLQEVDALSYLLAATVLLNSIQPVLSGVAVGSGWQAMVAYINLGCYYIIGLPLGIVMGWVFNFGVKGIWSGMILGGTVVQTVMLLIITIRCDWEKEDLNHPLLTDHAGDDDQQNQDQLLSRKVWIESKKLWRIVGPAIFSRISSYTMNIITQAFAGHLGDVDFAAISIANTVIVGFNFGLLLGMASALDTLCGQAFGAERLQMLGIYVQRSWIVLLMCCTLLLPTYVFATPILKILGQPDEVAELSGVVAQWMIPAHFSFAFLFPLQTFLQCQLKNRIIACVFPIGLVVNIFRSWLFVHVLDYGIVGASIAFDISWWFSVLGLFVYCTCGGCHLTWFGFSMQAFSGLWEFVKLSAASGVMLCLENWYYRILILMTGYLKNATLAVDALSIWHVTILLTQFFLKIIVRVANELGAGDGKAAKFATVVAVAESAAIGLFFCLLIIILRDKVALLFTSSVDVLGKVEKFSYLLAISILFNSVQPVLSGVAVGSGWQASVAYVNLGCYYVIGLPLGIVMGWVFNLGVMGIWGGMILGGTAVQTIILAIITIRCDWENEARKASQRMEKWSDPSPNKDRHHSTLN
ncbi:hypothetical protein Dsin_002863 [Dipteronia sinensis]|uniref:Protein DETOXIFICATION n=1 Tax=Dipteronia sinensis TaxID=43782 RepID=A0AAE0B7X2_9ROSI|nr:hypothetical protein Dsin_002863 [Dipteronia sinensis]